ncbi:TlpA disulfide reductase family protein [Pedobacter foliorum]|uniref:TlpA family protein disulfide reductase n=1 Tax=Pedobacter foliorum TaxID=2739058 RepID=UPI001565838C|nr:TlpA disulfide reductase family protein [Pedobacter foliorum]NRF37632.1 TlpA family protein disulfide reductase [Pedobacter foliorum]
MKTSTYLLLVFLIAGSTKTTNAQVSGVIQATDKSKWSLSNNDGWSTPVIADENGNYKVNIKTLKKGMYSLGEVGDIYLEPSYSLIIKKNNEGYEFSGKGSLENNLIQQIQAPLNQMNSNSGYGVKYSVLLTEPEKFFPIMDKYKEQALLTIDKSSNKFFKTLMHEEINYIRLNKIYNWKLFYGLDSTRMDSLKKTLSIPLAKRAKDYNQQLQNAYLYQFSKKMTEEQKKEVDELLYSGWDMNNELLFKNSSSYSYAINNRINFETRSGRYQKLSDSLKNPDQAKLIFIRKEINNDYIKDHFLYTTTLSLIRMSKSSTKVESFYKEYLSSTKVSTRLQDIEQAFKNLKATEKNAVVPDFSYSNPDNQLVSLKSMRGSFVYIDLWATWCAPCIAEIPALKKLELRLKEKNIKFVSISLDAPAEKNKWLSYVKDNDLHGIQLIADNDFKSEFVKKFGVNTIPRFLLIGPDGIVIDNDAKRPSNPELQKQLEVLLK